MARPGGGGGRKVIRLIHDRVKPRIARPHDNDILASRVGRQPGGRGREQTDFLVCETPIPQSRSVRGKGGRQETERRKVSNSKTGTRLRFGGGNNHFIYEEKEGRKGRKEEVGWKGAAAASNVRCNFKILFVIFLPLKFFASLPGDPQATRIRDERKYSHGPRNQVHFLPQSC